MKSHAECLDSNVDMIYCIRNESNWFFTIESSFLSKEKYITDDRDESLVDNEWFDNM